MKVVIFDEDHSAWADRAYKSKIHLSHMRKNRLDSRDNGERMKVKKAFGNVIGADFSKTEQRAIDIEIQRQLADWDEKNATEIDAMVLWVLMTEFGWGETRLRRFHDAFAPAVQNLVEYYRMDKSDMTWLCTQKLLDKGIDVAQWNKETEEWSSD